MEQCKAAGIRVGRVPSYSPSSIAEYAVSSIMALAKNIQKSYELTKTADFTIGGLQCMLLEDKGQAHDIFSLISRIRIYEFFLPNTIMEYLFWFSQIIKTEKEKTFLNNKDFFFFFN